MLSENEIERYSRQLILTGWGGREQERLKRVTAVIDTCYISAAIYLAAAGVGSIVMVGPILSPNGTGSLAAHISRLNPDIRITFSPGHPADLAPADAAGEIVSIGSSATGAAPAGLRIGGLTIDVGVDPERNLTLRCAAPGDGNRENHRAKNHSAKLPIPAGIDENLYAGTSAASFLLSSLLNLR